MVPPCWVLMVNMQAREGLSLEQIRVFLEASDNLGFCGAHPCREALS